MATYTVDVKFANDQFKIKTAIDTQFASMTTSVGTFSSHNVFPRDGGMVSVLTWYT